MLSTAHIFYIPVLLLVGAFAGYYFGRNQAERDAAEAARVEKRRRARAESSSGE